MCCTQTLHLTPYTLDLSNPLDPTRTRALDRPAPTPYTLDLSNPLDPTRTRALDRPAPTPYTLDLINPLDPTRTRALDRPAPFALSPLKCRREQRDDLSH
jgi:hypothetical protein